MRDLVIGVLGIVVGAVFCFRGYLTMRVVLPIWGAFVGFSVGTGLVVAFTDDGFLVGALAWIVGIALALLFAYLAYAYFAVSVLMGLASIGFLLGSSLMVALDIEWTWLVVLAGVAIGVAFAWLALVGNLPMVLLTILTATAGASAIVGGFMFIVGAIETADLERRAVVDRIDQSAWWWLLYIVLAGAGMVAQLRAMDAARRDLREAWARPRP